MEQREILRASGIKKKYGTGNKSVTVLKDIHLSVDTGTFVALKGRSGSGKTTLLNLLGALDRPTDGTIAFAGEDITTLSDRARDELRKSRIGLIFQSYSLIPIMSAYENVDFALRIAGVASKERKVAVCTAMEQVGLSGRMHHRPFELSGGEQQRTAIARAIAHKPSLLLADEPTAELDSKTGYHIIRLFRELVVQHGVTIILTTHDPAIMKMVDRVYELEDGQIVGDQ